MIYKGAQVPKNSSTAGVRQFPRGKNRGKWQAFYKDKEGLIYQGPPRDLKHQATFDLSLLKTRVYI